MTKQLRATLHLLICIRLSFIGASTGKPARTGVDIKRYRDVREAAGRCNPPHRYLEFLFYSSSILTASNAPDATLVTAAPSVAFRKPRLTSFRPLQSLVIVHSTHHLKYGLFCFKNYQKIRKHPAYVHIPPPGERRNHIYPACRRRRPLAVRPAMGRRDPRSAPCLPLPWGNFFLSVHFRWFFSLIIPHLLHSRVSSFKIT